jgi:hypothetical protein
VLASLGVVLATLGGSLAALVVTWSLLSSLADHMVAHPRGMLSQSRVVSVATLISGLLMLVVAVMIAGMV